jgi:GntR family transcriptional regulator
MSGNGLYNVDPSDPTPIYAQLERAIRFAIATERLSVGDRLPTVRQLAVDLRINANTVARVYSELERAGIVETRRGVGTFVCARDFEALPRGDRKRELGLLADRFLSDASNLGFSVDEVLDHLESIRKRKR